MSPDATSRSRGRYWGSFRFWLVALVAVLALAMVSTPSASSSAQRVAHLETLVKCPSCQDLSVAQSNSSSALAVRSEIVAMVAKGESDTQILTTIEAAYGSSVLLSPSTSGLGALLWILPSAVFVGLVVTVIVLRRRR
ncbi:MAG: cytochrome c-type biogenesis protein CcmH [Acidimicrobiaceae bacterium]|nr:cytochrome c-type biogenesis protein CcmH [Acidimicrobiaceae bacterium]